MNESVVLRSTMLSLTADGFRVFRNNVGVLQDAEGRYIRYGVCNPGGSDLIGWKTVEVTPEMVGKRVAVFTAVECKYKGRLTPEQITFLGAVSKAGGIARVAGEDSIVAYEAL